MAVLVIAVGGALLAWYGLADRQRPGADTGSGIVNKGQALALAPAPESTDSETALAFRYATAVQEGRCDDIVALTWWMQERLARVAAVNPDGADDERDRLCRSVTERKVERNRLTPEGLEDGYVFSPGATVSAQGYDEGRDGLAQPTARRIWLQVTYPSPDRALLDADGRPIRSLRAGVNLSVDGYVLKAGVNGNLDIDLESVVTEWRP